MSLLTRSFPAPLHVDISAGAINRLHDVVSDSRIAPDARVAVILSTGSGVQFRPQIEKQISHADFFELSDGSLQSADEIADKLSSYSSVIGVGGGRVLDAAKYAADGQIFEAKVYESLVDTLGKQKGPQTKADFENIQKTYVQLKNTPRANEFLLDVAEAKAMEDQRKANYYQEAAAMPSVRGNLSSITNAWQKISEKDSLFNVPLTDKAGNQYTLSQKYGIK